MTSIISYFNKNQWHLLLIFLFIHIVVSSFYIQHQDLTFDEKPYYNYAVRWIYGNVERVENIDDSKSPVVLPATFPRIVTQLFNKNYTANDMGIADMLQGRFFMCIYTILIAIILFYWIRDLIGDNNLYWVIPITLFLFDPMVLAYSMTILSDLASGFAMISTFFFLWRIYKTTSEKYFYFFCFSFSFALIVKPSFVFLIPCLLLFIILRKIFLKKSLNLISFKRVLVLIFTVILFINLAYQFKDNFRKFSTYKFKSQSFQSIQQKLNFLSNVPIPFPSTYIYSFDFVQKNKEIGGGRKESSYRGVYLNGVTKLHGGFWNYYFVTGIVKIPILTLLFFVSAFFLGIRYYKNKMFWQVHAFYIIPILFFGFILSFLNPFQIGLRHLLIIYPLFFIPVAIIISKIYKINKYFKIISLGLVIFFLIDIAFYFPNYISYSNWFVTDKKKLHLITNDSNIDYGQSISKIKDFIKLNPSYKIPTTKKEAGKFIVSIDQMQEFGNLYPNSITWLWQYKPIGHYQYSLLLFEISEKDIKE